MVALDALASSSNPSQPQLETIKVLVDKHSVQVYLKNTGPLQLSYCIVYLVT